MQPITEVLSVQQRIKRAMILSRNRSKIERARERSRARLADAKKIVERAMRLARKIVRTRVVGERGERYEDLSPAEKMEIDKVMQKRKDAIKKVALRLIQNVRKKEFERYKSFYMGKQLDHLHTESVQEQNTEMLLEQMIEAAQHLLITEEDNIRLESVFGNNDDFDLYKNYFVEALALEDNDSEMAMLRVVLLEKIDTELLVAEESVPKNPKLWARAVAWAKRTYDEYPSRWANQGAAKWYKKHGGEWKTISEDVLAELAVYKHGAESQGARRWVRVRPGTRVRTQQKHRAARGEAPARVRYVVKNTGEVSKYRKSRQLLQRDQMRGNYTIGGLARGKVAPISSRMADSPYSKRLRHTPGRRRPTRK